MRITKAEIEWIEEVGEDRFAKAEAHAMVSIKRDAHFVGMAKIREALAYEAAKRACGWPIEPLILPKAVGDVNVEVQSLAETLLSTATDAAAKAIGPAPPKQWKVQQLKADGQWHDTRGEFRTRKAAEKSAGAGKGWRVVPIEMVSA